MKCVSCDYDAPHKERASGRCPKCNARFVFEPMNGDPTDKAFAAAIDRISAGGTVGFTADHVAFEMARIAARRVTGWRRALLAVLLLGGVGVLAFIVASVLMAFGTAASTAMITGGAVLGGGVPLVLWRFLVWAPKSAQVPFVAHFFRWVEVRGEPAGLIRPRPARARLPAALTEELLAYSFDRVVVCDRPETVDVLLANDFHFENNCAVIGATGYPDGAFDLVRAMVKNNPHIEVFFLHDATPDGCALAAKLGRDPTWFRGQGRVYDVGLRPAQAEAFAGLWSPAEGGTPGWEADVGHLSAAERTWLTRWSLPIEVIPPEQLIKRLFRAMTELPARAPADAGGAGSSGGDHLIVVADTSDGGGDSFG